MTIPRFGNSELPTQQLSERELLRIALEDDYEIIEELGRGGMAIVLRAREKALDREVAIKVLPARLAMDEGFVERFEHEARTAAKLEHPNIVPIYRVGRAGPNRQITYFVMKLLRGQSLSAVLQERGKLDVGDVRRILMETASALGYAAKRSVVHRDIKPDNIMLDSEGRCVITDFGIAKAPGGQDTTAGISLGTPRYMSPEHAMGQPLDGRSDIYSLGVVAYQCLMGTPPYEADEPFAVLYKHIHEPLPEPNFESDDERQLYSIIARMLAKKPADRFQSSQELIAALGGQASDPMLVATMMTGPGLMAPTELIPTPQPWYMPWWLGMPPAQQRAVVTVGGLAMIALLGFAINSWQSSATAEPISSDSTNRPPTLPPVTVSAAGTVVDTAKPKPAGPSERAAKIIAYNKLPSSCPKRDTLVSAKPIAYAVLLDSIADRPRGEKMEIGYDVCGLERGSPISMLFTLTKLRQKGFGQQKPHEETQPEVAGSPRSRERWTLDIHEMSPGPYRLEVAVTDAKKRRVTAVREFRISDK